MINILASAVFVFQCVRVCACMCGAYGMCGACVCAPVCVCTCICMHVVLFVRRVGVCVLCVCVCVHTSEYPSHLHVSLYFRGPISR